MASEKRRRSRVGLALEAALSWDGAERTVTVKNLSLKGMLCEPTPGLGGVGDCQVVISLGEALAIRLQARVARADESGLAVDFTGMDEESFRHLRNLVRFNSSDPDAIDRELATPAFNILPRRN